MLSYINKLSKQRSRSNVYLYHFFCTIVRIDSKCLLLFLVCGVFDCTDGLIVMVIQSIKYIKYSYVAFIYQCNSCVCMHIDEIHVYYLPEQIFFAVYCSFLLRQCHTTPLSFTETFLVLTTVFIQFRKQYGSSRSFIDIKESLQSLLKNQFAPY